MTQKQLESLVKEWQKRLRLNDWNFSIRVCATKEMTGGVAEIATTTYKEAEIRILRDEDVAANPEFLMLDTDVEICIVHEMLHAQSIAISRYLHRHEEKLDLEWLDDEYELFIETTAQALVKAKRGE